MRKLLIRARQAPAIVIAILALVAAVAGVAIANPSAFTSGGPITKKKVKKISTNVVNSLAPGLSVKSAQTSQTANQPSMFAQVSQGGSFIGAHPGIGSVTKIGADGPYCFSGLARTPVGGQATVDWNDAGTDFAQFGVGEDVGHTCPSNTQAFVGTFDANDPVLIAAAGFFVTIY
jgi:hypothetical protein